MDSLILNLQNSSNWRPVWSGSVQRQPVPNSTRFYPIGTVRVPILLDRPIIAINTNSDVPLTWKMAGYLRQVIPTGLTIGGMPNANLVSRSILLNRLNLLVLPQLTNEYEIYIDVVRWLVSLSIDVWEFTGTVDNQVEFQLEIIKSDIARLESKVESLDFGV